MRFGRQLAAALIAGGVCSATLAQAAPGWIVDFTWRYEAQAGRMLRGGRAGPGGADTRASGASDIRITAEARGTMHFAEQLWPGRYKKEEKESWRFKGGTPAFVSIDMHAQFDEAARINLADGEGANQINAERKGLIGRVQHERRRVEAKAAGEEAGWIGEHADLTIDRVANKLRIENRIDLQLNRKTVQPTLSEVKRMDKPPAAGQWDRSGADKDAWRALPQFAPRNEIVFDIPAGADQFTLTRSFEAKDMPDPHEYSGVVLHPDFRSDSAVSNKHFSGRGTLTLNVRRMQAAAAATAPAAPPAAAGAPAPATATTSATAATPASAAAANKAEPAKPAKPSAAEEAVDAVKKLRGLFGR